MIIRFPRPEDEIALSRLHRQKFNSDFVFPDQTTTVTQLVAEVDGEVVGFGLLKPLAEAFLLLDQEISNRHKVNVIRELLASAILMANKRGYQEIQAITEDEKFALMLMKHFGFQQYVGQSLVLDVR